MPITYKILVTPKARTQLSSIYNYIKFELNSNISADNTLNILENAINSLEQLPNRFPIIENYNIQQYKIHKMSVKNYLVYYTVDECEAIVTILAVIYAHCNQKYIF